MTEDPDSRASADGSGTVIEPWTIDRGECVPRLDVAKMELQQIEPVESVYTRQLVKFPDASLPASISFSSEPSYGPSGLAGLSAQFAPAATGAASELTVVDVAKAGKGTTTTTGSGGGDGGTSPGPSPGPSTTRSPAPRPPEIFNWDLFLMLRYRQDIAHDKYGLGDLLFSVSLMPNEEMSLEVKTWETSKIQQDQEDLTEQRNTSDIKTNTSLSSEVANRSESKEHEAVDAKAGYGGFGFSAEVSTDWSQDVEHMQSNTGRQAQDRSEQTAHEFRSSHKTRLSVSREDGSESKTTRRLRNINQAHTLTANYYEVVQQLVHTLNLYDASLVLFGVEAQLAAFLPYANPDTETGALTLGHLIRYSRDDGWISNFIDLNGISPIKVLRQAWAKPLYDGALVAADFLAGGAEITSDQRELFRSTMLRFVHPSPGWIEPDEAGALRWGYEIFPAREGDALPYLYGFLPYSAQQQVELAIVQGAQRSSAFAAIATRYAQAVQPSYVRVAPNLLRTAALATADAAPPDTAANDVYRVPGPFFGKKVKGTETGSVSGTAAMLVKHVTDELEKLRALTKTPRSQAGKWTTIIPTHGVYSDLVLGVCSGAEDYIEIQRQLDLERRKLENERLRLENQRLADGNPVPTLVVDDQTGRAQLRVDVKDAVGADAAGRIDIRDSEH
jgi:hypothetical protein